MSQLEEYDAVVVGSGETGKYLAWHLASTSQRVAIVERRYVGGSYPNVACLPSKSVIHSAKIADHLRRPEEFGIRQDDRKIDMAGFRATASEAFGSLFSNVPAPWIT